MFSNGVDFALEVRARRAVTDGRGDLFGGVHGHGDPGDRLLLGIEFSDGRRCTNIVEALDFDGGDAAELPQLMPGGGSGGIRSGDVSLFLSPLPPPGDLRVVCAWPKRGLLETNTVLSADDILEASQSVRVLWPWEPEPSLERSAQATSVPEGGWFAEQQAQTHRL